MNAYSAIASDVSVATLFLVATRGLQSGGYGVGAYMCTVLQADSFFLWVGSLSFSAELTARPTQCLLSKHANDRWC